MTAINTGVDCEGLETSTGTINPSSNRIGLACTTRQRRDDLLEAAGRNDLPNDVIDHASHAVCKGWPPALPYRPATGRAQATTFHDVAAPGPSASEQGWTDTVPTGARTCLWLA